MTSSSPHFRSSGQFSGDGALLLRRLSMRNSHSISVPWAPAPRLMEVARCRGRVLYPLMGAAWPLLGSSNAQIDMCGVWRVATMTTCAQ